MTRCVIIALLLCACTRTVVKTIPVEVERCTQLTRPPPSRGEPILGADDCPPEFEVCYRLPEASRLERYLADLYDYAQDAWRKYGLKDGSGDQ